MTLLQVELDDKYRLESKRIFLSGTQALVRLPMLQRERDRLQGLNTGGFISGYLEDPDHLQNALSLGVAASALKHTMPGDVGKGRERGGRHRERADRQAVQTVGEVDGVAGEDQDDSRECHSDRRCNTQRHNTARHE